MKRFLLSCSVVSTLFLGHVGASALEDLGPTSRAPTHSSGGMLFGLGNYESALNTFTPSMDMSKLNFGLCDEDCATTIASFALSYAKNLPRKDGLTFDTLCENASPTARSLAFTKLLLHDTKQKFTNEINTLLQSEPQESKQIFSHNATAALHRYAKSDAESYGFYQRLLALNPASISATCYLDATQTLTYCAAERDHAASLAKLPAKRALLEQAHSYFKTYEERVGTLEGYAHFVIGNLLAEDITLFHGNPLAQKKLADDAIAHYDTGRSLQTVEEQRAFKTLYIDACTATYSKVHDDEKILALLDEFPFDVEDYQHKTLIHIINAHIRLGLTHHALPYIEHITHLVKTKSHDLAVMNCAISVAEELAFSGMFAQAAELLKACKEAMLVHYIPDTHRASFKNTLITCQYYIDVENAFAMKNPGERRKALTQARILIHQATHYSLTSKEYMTKFFIARFRALCALGGQKDAKVYYEIKQHLENLGLDRTSIQALEPKKAIQQPGGKGKGKDKPNARKPAAQSKTTPNSLENYIRASVKNHYLKFATDTLNRLAADASEVQALATDKISHMHAELTDGLKHLKAACEDTGTQDPARFMELSQTYGALEGRLPLYKALISDIRNERKRVLSDLYRKQEARTSTSSDTYTGGEGSALSNVRAQYDHTKPVTSSSSNASSSTEPTRSSSTSPSVSTPLSVSVTYSKRAEKEKKTLVSLNGAQAKLERFIDEIKKDPYLVHINEATGRAEALRVEENLYSRRFDQKNRLVYRVTKDAKGAVHVKILSLLTHYKGLHLS
ncbi:MAG: type II toxin-antitoxin system YoeB family toxin [Proteobacteria bacterium]|nr:type II toxin-antitoxin system YoeB family toxin [Pseudomonadota bacterium]